MKFKCRLVNRLATYLNIPAVRNTIILSVLFVIVWRYYVFRDSPGSLKNDQISLTIHCNGGRLGNQMFLYAALFGLANLNRRQGRIQYCNGQYLINYFQITLPLIDDISIYSTHNVYPILSSIRLPEDANIPGNVEIITGYSFPESYTFFDTIRNDLRREFRFKEEFLNVAQTYLSIIKGDREHVTFVGVHVRRTDYFHHLEVFHLRPANMTFFKKAFAYFRGKYADAVFVVVSDDLEWCQNQFLSEDTYVGDALPLEPVYDLAILSECNHTIFDYGTFGFWGAFLAGGETVYFANKSTSGYEYYIEDDKFYLPEWKGM